MYQGIMLEPEILLSLMRMAGFSLSRRFNELEISGNREEIEDYDYLVEMILAHKAKLFEILPDEGLFHEDGRRLDAQALRALRDECWPRRKAKPDGKNLDLFEDGDKPDGKKATRYGLRMLK